LVTGCGVPALAREATTAENATAILAKPNIIFVLTDDQPYYSLARMPNVQRLLVDEGKTFTETFASYPLCCPGRATLMRGQYAHNHGVLSNNPPLGGYPRFREQGHLQDNLATRLDSAGYRTALIGKWLNYYETRRVPPGFDRWVVQSGEHRQMRYNEEGTIREYEGDHMDTMFSNKAQDWLGYASGLKQPIFLWAGFYAPHSSGFDAKYGDRYQGVDAPDRPDIPYAGDEAERNGDKEYRRQLRDLATVDDFVGRAVTILKKSGELDNTYFIFYTDNGAHPVGYHGLDKGKQTPYSLDTEFPLVIRGPDVAAGAESEALTSSNDVMPTLLEMSGAPVPDYADGRPLKPLFDGDVPSTWRTGLMSEKHDGWNALREDGLKYVEYANGKTALYRLPEYPFELNNVADEAPPEELARLSARLDTLKDCQAQDCRAAED
ncbi:MAG: sulfatase, partial [Actinomycetota bacterium]|nr:sulfatase [Actinomycetota bacterium]